MAFALRTPSSHGGDAMADRHWRGAQVLDKAACDVGRHLCPRHHHPAAAHAIGSHGDTPAWAPTPCAQARRAPTSSARTAIRAPACVGRQRKGGAMQVGTRGRAQARRERASQEIECKPRAESRVARAHGGGSRELRRRSSTGRSPGEGRSVSGAHVTAGCSGFEAFAFLSDEPVGLDDVLRELLQGASRGLVRVALLRGSLRARSGEGRGKRGVRAKLRGEGSHRQVSHQAEAYACGDTHPC